MERSITAIFEDGVLKPTTPLELPPHTLVRLTVESCEGTSEVKPGSWEELEQLWDEVQIDFGGPRPTRDELHDRD